MNGIAETHLFQACTIERDRGTQQGACVALPEVSTVVAAPPAHAARAGAAAPMWQMISACTPPLRPVGRAGRTKARVHVGSAHRSPKGTAAKMRARELMRARSGEKRRALLLTPAISVVRGWGGALRRLKQRIQ